MPNILMINGRQPSSFSSGRLNTAFVDRARTQLCNMGYCVRETRTADGWDAESEITNHRWADAVFVQFPLHWMGVPWGLKQYMDEVYTRGMDGRLCSGDGRSRGVEDSQYGTGGTLTNTAYMLSLTLNAPASAFDDPDHFFGGRSIDDLLIPYHMNFRFFGMRALPTFVAYDVAKQPNIEGDFARFEQHLATAFETSATRALNIAA